MIWRQHIHKMVLRQPDSWLNWTLEMLVVLNLYHMTKFSVYLSFTVNYFNTRKKWYFHISFCIRKNCFGLFLLASLLI